MNQIYKKFNKREILLTNAPKILETQYLQTQPNPLFSITDISGPYQTIPNLTPNPTPPPITIHLYPIAKSIIIGASARIICCLITAQHHKNKREQREPFHSSSTPRTPSSIPNNLVDAAPVTASTLSEI